MSVKRRFLALTPSTWNILRFLLAVLISTAIYLLVTTKYNPDNMLAKSNNITSFVRKKQSAAKSVKITTQAAEEEDNIQGRWWEGNVTQKVEWKPMETPLPSPQLRHSLDMEKRVLQFVSDMSRYFAAKMRTLIACQIAKKCPIQALIFDVSDPLKPYGGSGDRMRGMASMFYIALASERVFLIKWETPASLADVFQGPAYSQTSYEKFLAEEGKPLKRSDNYFKLYEHDAPMFFDKSLSIISTNEICLQWLHFISIHDELRHKLDHVVARAQKYNLTFTYELATFTALRILLGNPRPVLKKEVDKLWGKVEDQKHDGCRIGVQIRVAPSGFYKWYTDYARINQKQLENCFQAKIVNMTKECPKKTTPIVYLTSDSVEAKQFLQSALENASIASAVSGFKTPYHLDNDMHAEIAEARRRAMVETFAEWLLLGRMNHLLISRSGYGELASTFGSFLSMRRPSYRLPHGYQQQACNFESDYHLKSSALDSYTPGK